MDKGALARESRAALAILGRAIELLPTAPELRTDCQRLGRDLDATELVVELVGARRASAIQAFIGEPVADPPAGVVVWLRAGGALDFDARFADGRTERAPVGDHPLLSANLAEIEMAILAARDEVAALERKAAEPPAPPPEIAPPRRSGWQRFLDWLFRRKPAAPALPPPAVDDVTPALEQARARLAALNSERNRKRADLVGEQRGRVVARVQALVSGSEGPVSIEVRAPGVPDWATLVVGIEGDQRLRLDEYALREQLAARLEQMRADRPAELARRVTAALCVCRNHIADLDRQARQAHESRLEELSRAAEVQALRGKAEAAAQMPLAREAERIVQDAVAQLEKWLAEVRTAWEQRIASCAGIEQLRTEVAAIEAGAAYRLSLVCDELRENLTVKCARTLLELLRPLRHDLLHRRHEVARGRSPAVEETFEDIRVTLPAQLDATFGALRTPDLGVLLATERGLLDPIFRTLAREKRDCTARLAARLDDIERSTVRELFASAVYLSPLLGSTFARVASDLVAAHERWVDARIEEERAAAAALRERQAPALALVDSLAEKERLLAQLLEISAAVRVDGAASSVPDAAVAAEPRPVPPRR